MVISINACPFVGTPVVALRAALVKTHKKRTPKPIDHRSVSMCHDQKPASLQALLNAIPFSVVHMTALVKWCWIYSEVVYSDAIV